MPPWSACGHKKGNRFATRRSHLRSERVISVARAAKLRTPITRSPGGRHAAHARPDPTFDEQGYLFFPNCFAEEEVAVLRDEAEHILRSDRREVWREKTGAPRTAFAAHTYNEAFRLMAHHPRLVQPLQQLFGEGVYVHQFKINAKAAFEGDVWQWHQDYGTWARDDGMPEPRAMNISDLSRRGAAHQRAADDHPEEPQIRHARRGSRRARPPIRSGRSMLRR